MLVANEADLRKALPAFDAHKLVGANIDEFHANPMHQRRLLEDQRNLPYQAKIRVGNLEFTLNVTAIIDSDGKYVGDAVQWSDITHQMDAERQVAKLIDEAAAGRIESRIDGSNYDGFMKNLADGINRMLDAFVDPIEATKGAVARLAEGDLTATMDGDYGGSFAELQGAVNTSIRNLYKTVGEIRLSASSITMASSEIAQGNTDLSRRTEQAASSLEQTASSMEELAGTVRHNAASTRDANQLAASARELAEKGGKVVCNAVSAMGEIHKSSKKIADIIGVIDEIAFQTNLLALNAAVEAARAGDQGRGFAVVASEVRNLAQRSASAAKDIKALISDSVEKVEDGTRLVGDSGATLQEIVKSVKKVSDIIGEIAASSNEQSAGIEEVNRAVVQLDELTQANGSLVEQAAAASESLDEQARSLDDLVGYFRLGSADAGRAAASLAGMTAGAASAATSTANVRGPARRHPPSRSRPTGGNGDARRVPNSAGYANDQEWQEF